MHSMSSKTIPTLRERRYRRDGGALGASRDAALPAPPVGSEALAKGTMEVVYPR